MLKIGPEPEGMLLRRSDVLVWLPGLTGCHWRRIRRALTPIVVAGASRPYYRKSELKTKLVNPLSDEKSK